MERREYTEGMRRAPIIALVLAAALTAAAMAQDRSAADKLFAERAAPKKLAAAADAYAAAKDEVMVARCCFLRIEIHDDLAEDKKAREKWIERGLAAGAAALGVNEPEEDPDKVDKKGVEALYWYAALYGRKTEMASIFSQAGMAKRFRKLCERAVALDGKVAHGGPHRMLGTFCAEAPGLLGGDDDKAKEQLDLAVKVGPDYFENRLLRAENVHLERDDKAAFEADLKAVIDAKDDVIPDLVPEQKRAKAAAKKLLDENR